MSRREFAWLVESGLLDDVERIVVDAHRASALRDQRPWRPPDAYRWLRYENADPVTRLGNGVEKLRRRGGEFDAEAVEKACAKASAAGYSN